MEELYLIECGKKRLAEKVNCLQCNKEFLRRIKEKKGKRIYCSRECSSLTKMRRISVICYMCGKNFDKPVSKCKKSKSGLHFCSRKCKDFAQAVRGGCEQIRPDHYGTGTGINNYRSRVSKEDFAAGCIVCGEKKFFKICVHHIDGDRNNNVRSNLEVVCHNCHSVRHLSQNTKTKELVLSYKFLSPKEIVDKFDMEEKMNKFPRML